MKYKRTDLPTSVTERVIKGVRYTVRIYDEAAYLANIAECYPEQANAESSPAQRSAPRNYTPRRYKKRKPQARYNWVGDRVHISPALAQDPQNVTPMHNAMPAQADDHLNEQKGKAG